MRLKLYLQICSILLASLLGFALLAALAWEIVGHDQSNQDLFTKSAALAELLLPHEDSARSSQQRLDSINAATDIRLALYDKNGQWIAGVGGAGQPPQPIGLIPTGTWITQGGSTRWVTKLRNGRVLVAGMDRIALPGESAVFTGFLGVLALGIAMIMYPFVRRLTARLERLQLGAKQIALGNLGARVPIEGDDEVAQLASDFNQAAERIEELVNAQKLLVANVSHELRTPLTRIRLGIEMLENGDGQARRASLKQDITELDTLIDEIIMMTRIDIGVRQLETFDLTGLVAEECSHYEGCDLEATQIDIQGDRRLIQHALRNLLDNAYQHGAEPVNVTISNHDQVATIRVEDSGSGFSASEFAKMLEPFQRGKHKQDTQGSGLGLPLVKRIAEAHGGILGLDPDNRSAVVVQFPLIVYDDQSSYADTGYPKSAFG